MNSNYKMSMKKMMFLPLLAFICLLGSCSDDDIPVEAISYALPEHMQVGVEYYEPVIIKSDAEFDALFSAYKDEMEKVDFAHYDLVYMQGRTGICEKLESIRSWIDTSVYPYQMHVRTTETTRVDGKFEKDHWAVAFLLPKSDRNKVIYNDGLMQLY